MLHVISNQVWGGRHLCERFGFQSWDIFWENYCENCSVITKWTQITHCLRWTPRVLLNKLLSSPGVWDLCKVLHELCRTNKSEKLPCYEVEAAVLKYFTLGEPCYLAGVLRGIVWHLQDLLLNFNISIMSKDSAKRHTNGLCKVNHHFSPRKLHVAPY